jgi:hypothetical protein
MSALSFRNLLENGDVDSLRASWAVSMPHLPQPETRKEAEIVMHRARTETESISFKARAYSHRWLVERMVPSGLPDDLKPRAERIYPQIVQSVGISVNASSEFMKPAALQIRKSMEDAVNDAYAEKRTSPEFLRARMMEARAKTQKLLLGRMAI